MPFELQLLEPWDCPEPIGGWIAGEFDVDPVRPHSRELLKWRDRHQLSGTDDPDAIADVLHLGQNMR